MSNQENGVVVGAVVFTFTCKGKDGWKLRAPGRLELIQEMGRRSGREVQGKVVYGCGAEGLSALIARPVRVCEVLYTGEKVGAVVVELWQER